MAKAYKKGIILKYYEVLSNLKINNSLLEDLKSINWSKQDQAFKIDYVDFELYILKKSW